MIGEGISHEACSLAGTLGLGKLICFYDDNGISIDGHVEGWFTDDTPARFRAYGWHVVAGVDGHDPAAIEAALAEAQGVADRPSLVCCRTVIGLGSPNKAGTHDVHGAALGAAEVAATRVTSLTARSCSSLPLRVPRRPSRASSACSRFERPMPVPLRTSDPSRWHRPAMST